MIPMSEEDGHEDLHGFADRVFGRGGEGRVQVGVVDLDGDEQQASGDRGQAGRSEEFGGGDGHVRLRGPAARAAAAARWRYSSQSHSD